MTKYGLRARILAYTIIPTLLIGTLLAGYFSHHRYQQLEEALVHQGVNIIQPLAIASELALNNRNRESLNRLLSNIHRNNSTLVKGIALFDANGRLLVTSSYHHNVNRLRLPQDGVIPEQTQVVKDPKGILLRTPILSAHADIDSDWDTSAMAPIGYISMALTSDSATLLYYKDSLTAALIVLLATSLSALFGIQLIRRVSQPISDMVNAIYKIREGHLDTRVTGVFTGEMETLKNGINAMAKSLIEYHEEMQQSVDQATSDLRETLEQIEIQNIELDIAKKRAQAAAHVKTEFLANMSHELRTPLNGVIGFARQLQKTRLTPNQLDYLKTIERSAENLLGIINDILDFSKLEAGKLKMEKLPFSLRDTLQEVTTLLAPSAHDKGLELSLRVDAAAQDSLLGDPLRLQQVLTNLVGNAIKFTEQGNVDIRIDAFPASEPQLAALRIHVQDTGIGISEKQRRQLFQAFNQADSSISRRYGGTGLGLVITQKLVHQMGGIMDLHSELGVGSVFSFTLELECAQLPLAEPLPLTNLSKKSVLYVEQDNFSRRATNALLGEWGIQVIYDLQPEVTVDFVLLGFTSETLPSQIQEDIRRYAHQGYKVVVLVSSTDLLLIDSYLEAGAITCLSKPVHYQRLAQALMGKPTTEPETQLQVALPSPTAKQDLRVLAVDDNIANLKLISAMLSEQVQLVDTGSDGQQALHLAMTHRYDIIFMDIQMPIMDGIQATQAIRASDGPNKATHIVAVTAHAIEGERDHLLQQGISDYLSKPIDESILARIIKNFSNTYCPTGQINWQHALDKVGQKDSLAKEMLRLLLVSFNEFEPYLTAALADELTSKEFYAPLHKLHGGALYCGVAQLQSLLAELEQALLDNVALADLVPELLELEERISQVQQEADNYL